MEQARLLIAIVLSFLVFFIWHLFFTKPEPVKKSAPQEKIASEKREQPTTATPYVKKEEVTDRTRQTSPQPDASLPQRIPRTITVDTPLYRVQISEKGAGFNRFVLKRYREKVEKNSPLKDLLPKEFPLETVQLKLARNSIPGLENAIFSTQLTSDDVSITDSSQQITFFWQSEQGILIEKTFRFSPESYLIDLDVSFKNGSDQTIQDSFILSLKNVEPKEKRAYGFEGPSALIGKEVEQVKIKKIAEQNTYSGQIKWIALQDRYFLNSVIPEKVEESSLRLFLNPDNIIEAQYLRPEVVIQPGTQYRFRYYLYFGPKSMKVLGDVGYDLGDAIDFGMFDFIAKPCVWLMNFLYSVIPNYGVAIIILTIMVKIILWPLGTKSYKSMNEMKKLQPLMKEIREKYKNDKKKMNEEVMSLYKTYKINPLGGCLPMIVQIPVFFALYRMLYEAIELRHAPFIFWIDDLSAPDRLFRFDFAVPFMEPPYGIPVLTLVMGATMLLQQKMSPPMGDPTQAKMMMLMPIFFTVIFINFSSGLVLYWLVNNVLSIAQQYYISKKFA